MMSEERHGTNAVQAKHRKAISSATAAIAELRRAIESSPVAQHTPTRGGVVSDG